MIDKLNIGQKFIITYRPNTHNGEARAKLKDGKRTRQITRRAQWNDTVSYTHLTLPTSR